MAIAKEQLQQIIADNDIKSVGDIYSLFKDSFKDMLQEVKEWQSRPLELVYPFVFMDAIHYKIREDGRILNRAAYVVLGVILDGTKDILSINIGTNESSKFWLDLLND